MTPECISCLKCGVKFHRGETIALVPGGGIHPSTINGKCFLDPYEMFD